MILAWAEILPALPPATRAAVRDAQPLSVDGDVITFGVPRGQYEAALPRFKKEADNIREALSDRLGRRMKFKPVAHDGFDAGGPVRSAPSRTKAAAPPAPAERDEPPLPDGSPEPAHDTALDEPPDDVIDLDELTDAPPAEVGGDSVSILARAFDATVVEEVPRD